MWQGRSYRRIVIACSGLGLFLLLIIILVMGNISARSVFADPQTVCSGYSAWCTSNSLDSGPSSTLSGVAVVSSTNVWAAGYSVLQQNSNQHQTLIEHWDGTSWSLVTSSNPSTYTNLLVSVAAGFSGDVITNIQAVGDYSYGSGLPTHILCERRILNQFFNANCPEPGTALSSTLYKVYAVPNSNDFWSVGEYEDTSNYNFKALIEHWHGASWVSTTLGLAGHNQLLGVTAYDVNNAWAVGYTDASGDSRALILHWNGSSWSTMTPATVNHTSELVSIDVFTPSDVWAVGSYGDGSIYAHTLIEHYDGNSWTVVPAPDPGTTNILNEVWVTQAGDVWVAGSYTPQGKGAQSSGNFALLTPQLRLPRGRFAPNGSFSTEALIFHWHGNDWDSIPVPHPGANNEFLGISASLTSTWAVGDYDTHTLVERMVAPQQAPAYLTSNYESTVDTQTHFGEGCNAAHQNFNGGMVVLDYGQPRAMPVSGHYGTLLFDLRTLASTDQIATAVESYMDGYYAAYNPIGNCGYIGNSAVPITVAIGTSNFNKDEAADFSITHAQAWADMVGAVKSYVTTHGYNAITVVAAMDIEPDYSIPYRPTPTPTNFDYNYPAVATWVSSYTGRGVSPLYNYGSTDGFPCFPSGTPMPVSYGCSVWNTDQLYKVSWGIPGTNPLPEAYYAQYNWNWYVVKRYGELAYPTATPMTFAGSVTDCLPGQVCYVNPSDPHRQPELTINQGWGSLWTEINGDPFFTQPLTGSTYIITK